MKKKKNLKIGILFILLLIVIAIVCFNINTNYKISGIQGVQAVSNAAEQASELPKVNITIQGPDRIEKLLGQEVQIKANVSITENADAFDTMEYEWFRVGRKEGTASVYNIVEGQTTDTLTLSNLKEDDSAKYQLAVKFFKDGVPLQDPKRNDTFKAYSQQITVYAYPELNIDILGNDKTKVEDGEIININYGEHYKLNEDIYRIYQNGRKEKVVKAVTWSSNDDTTLTVDQSGYLTTVNYGKEAEITAKITDIDGTERTDKVTVKVNKVDVSSIEMVDSITLKPEQVEKIEATVKPENATIKDIEWSIVEGDDIIDLDPSGIVTAKTVGTAKVKAKVDGKEAICTVNVKKPEVESITDDVEEHHIYIIEHKELVIHTNAHPLDADPELNWHSDDESVAKVEKVDGQNGKITAQAYKDGKSEEENTCKVTVTSNSNPSVSLEYQITVVKDVKKVTDVTLNQEDVTLEVGEEFNFIAHIEPDNATYSSVEWSIEPDNVATIDDSGAVHAKEIGEATVTLIVKCAHPDCPTHKVTAKVNVVKTDVTGINISNEKMTLRVGDEENLTAEVTPYNATNKKIKWETSDDQIVEVDQNGKIKAVSTGTTKGNGKAIITARSEDNTKIYAQCEVTVTPINVEGIEISKKTLKLKEGAREKLEATIEPEIASDQKVIWESSNEDVATVDQDGNVVAIKEGTAIIKAISDENRNIYQECVVTVVPAAADVTIYTVDQNNNFISGMTLKVTRITDEGEIDIIELQPTKGKYEIKGLEDGDYKISVVGKIPTEDINGNKINIVEVVKDYVFTVQDGRVIYVLPEDEEIDILYTNDLVLVNIVDDPNVENDTDGLSPSVGIGEDYTVDGKTIEQRYNEFDKNNPVKPSTPVIPETPENPGDTENPDEDMIPDEQEPSEDEKTPSKNIKDDDLPNTSDIAIGAYIVMMLVSLSGIIFVLYKKAK